MIPQEIACWLPPTAVLVAILAVQYARRPWQAKTGLAAAAIMLALGAHDGITSHHAGPAMPLPITEGAR